MKNKISSLIFAILFISITCHNQYYISNPKYNEKGTEFTGNLDFKQPFNPDNYDIDWNNKTSYLLNPIEKLNIKISL